MFNWEDTVMTDEQITDAEVEYCKAHGISFPLHGAYRDICLIETQANIAFAAGEKEGMRKVMDWIKKNSSINQGVEETGRLSFFVLDEWRAFLKENELNDSSTLRTLLR